MDIKLNPDKNLVLIDTSYFIIYRYYATLQWYKFKLNIKKYNKKEESPEIKDVKESPEIKDVEEIPVIDIENLHTNEEFVATFLRMCKQNFKKWQKDFKSLPANTLFCLDVERKTIWRFDHHNTYKGTRESLKNFNSNFFTLFFDLLKSEGYNTLKSERLEADDVIYLTIKYLRENCKYHKNITVITNDNDLLQLKSFAEVCIINAKGLDITTRGLGDPSKDVIYKIIYGDNGDNITPICDRIGKVTALKLTNMSEEDRMEWINKKKCMEKYLLNDKLIRLTNIPHEYADNFTSKLKIIL